MIDRLLALKKTDHRVLPATHRERAEAYISPMDRHQRGVEPPGQFSRPRCGSEGPKTAMSTGGVDNFTKVGVMLKDDSLSNQVANATVMPPPLDGITTEATLVSEL